MRKSLFFAGLAAAALTLVGCNKEADLAPQSKSVEIVLSDAQTRTVNDGMSTIWKSGDQLSVFFAPTGTTTWSANNKFTVQDVSSNRATGTVTLEADANDWYAFYPYQSKLPNPTTVNPAGSDYERSGYTTVGGLNQSQKEDDNTEHLAGKNVPVFGNVKNVPANEIPAIEMKNAASVLRFKVTNAKTEDIHILSVKFFAPEDIVGTYYIDFSGTAPTFVGSGATYVFDNVTVNNASPVDLAPDSNSEFYAVIKPFTAASGSKLKIEVEAETVDGSKRGIATKEITLTAATDFKAGYIKTLTVPFDASFESFSATTLAEAIALADDTEVELETLTVGAVGTKGYVVTDGTNGLYVYLNSKPDVTVGEQVNVSGKLATYYNVRQLNNSAYTKVADGDGTFEATWTDITANFESYSNTSSAPVKYEATVVKNGTYTNFKVEGADTYVGTLTNAPSSMFEGVDEGAKVTVYGYFSTINQTNKLVGVYAYKVVVSEAPFFDANVEGSKDVTVPASTQTVTVDVSSNVDWTAEASTGATVDPASGNGSGTITVSFPANTDPNNTKEYSVTVRTDDPTLVASGDEEAVIDITQEAFDDSDLQYTWDLSIASYNTPTSATEVIWSADMATMKAEKDKANTNANSYLGGDANNRTSSRFYTGSKLTITPVTGITIKYVEFTATSEGYATALASSTWTNATAAVDATNKKLVTVTPDNGAQAMVAAIGGTCGFTGVTVHYSGTAKALTSIAVTGQKTDFTVGDTFTHDTAVVTATYSDNTTKDVTASATFTAPDMATAGTKEVTVSYTEGVTKTTSYNITVSEPSTLTVSQAVALADNDTGIVGDAIVAAICTKGFIATDGTQNVYVFMNKQPEVALGDKVSFSFEKTTFYDLPELKTIKNLTVASHDNTIPRTTLKDITATIDTYTSSETDYLTVTGTLVKSGNYYNVTVSGATKYATPMYLYGIDPSMLVDQQVVMTGYFNTINSSKGAVQFIATEIKAADANVKYCTVSPEVLNVSATATSATLSIQANAAWTVSSDNSAFTVSPASGNADATVTVSFSANGSSATRVTNLTVSCPDASVTKTVVLTQAGKAAEGKTDVLQASDFTATSTNYANFSGVSKPSGAVYAGNSAKSADGAIQLRSNNSNSGIVSTTSGGKVKTVVVTWNSSTTSGRTLNIYGKSSSYTDATDLYNSASRGTLLGTIVCGTSTVFSIEGDYEFVGIRSSSGALMLDKVEITWE